jgi:RNA polymerase sigma factor (TIGR02999 family)
MSDVTKIMGAIDAGDAQASAELLPLVYAELKRIAAAHLAGERAGHTLQPTALVHEAYIRLIGNDNPKWQSRAHFFGAAAEAMRRILIDNARRKKAARRGGSGEGAAKRVELDADIAIAPTLDPSVDGVDLIALDEALARLAAEDKTKAELVKLRFFAGLSIEETAANLGISRATAVRYWTYARAWLHNAMTKSGS